MRFPTLILLLAALSMAAVPAGAVADALDAVVEVRAPGSTGTGFVIEGNRVVSAAHVVESSPVTVVTAEGNRSAVVVLQDAAVDLAVLAVDEVMDVRPLELHSQPLNPAEDVFAATAQPFGGLATLSRGIVSGVVEHEAGQVVQTDAAVNPGSSGGPLLRPDGAVVGVISSKLDGAEGVAFAVPTATLLAALDRADRVDVAVEPTAPGEGREAQTPIDSPTTRYPEWLPLTAVVVLLLLAGLSVAASYRRRRRQPPAPGPFEIDVRLHDAVTDVSVHAHDRKDLTWPPST